MGEIEDKVRIETIQNWSAFCLIALGIGLGLMYSNPLTVYITAIGLAASLFFIISRTLSKSPKKFTLLTIVAILCWMYILLSYALVFVSPTTIFSTIYGDSFQGLYNWGLTLLFFGFVGLGATIIELFRTSKHKD